MEYKDNSKYTDIKSEQELKKKFGSGFEVDKPNYLSAIMVWALVIVLSVVIALILRAYVFEWVIVDGQSMENTLYNRQVLFINKLEYKYSSPERGDIVIIQIKEGNWDYFPFIRSVPALTSILPSKDELNYIKRIIGLPGDVIDIKDGYVLINDTKLDEPYIKGVTFDNGCSFPLVVPENSYFVMGDNRQYSRDSRQAEIGFIQFEKLKGKAVLRIRPLKEFGSIYE
ncbi:MAG: signal peptidase I [Clostridiaceae bacterium]|nr:signal peptidase I [Clostridiaceae bacterium]